MNPWTWKIAGFNALNAGLLAAAVVLALKGRLLLAAVPAGVLVVRRARF
jgi:hypothetical protein